MRACGPADYIFGAAEWELLWGPCYGGTMVLAPQGAERDPSRMIELLASSRIS